MTATERKQAIEQAVKALCEGLTPSPSAFFAIDEVALVSKIITGREQISALVAHCKTHLSSSAPLATWLAHHLRNSGDREGAIDAALCAVEKDLTAMSQFADDEWLFLAQTCGDDTWARYRLDRLQFELAQGQLEQELIVELYCELNEDCAGGEYERRVREIGMQVRTLQRSGKLPRTMVKRSAG